MNQFNKDIIAVLSSDKDITLNEVLRRQIEVALDRFIMTQVREYNDKFENRAHRGFKDCHDTLDSMF